jgi:hypothetical protein
MDPIPIKTICGNNLEKIISRPLNDDSLGSSTADILIEKLVEWAVKGIFGSWVTE